MNGIGFKNMKVFAERQWFDFKPITLLTGTNNSGKSSVINAMQMIQENLSNFNKRTIDELVNTEFRLKINLNKHGNIEGFINRDNDKKEFSFSLKEKNIKYSILVEINKGLESYGAVKAIIAKDFNTDEIVFSIEILKNQPGLKIRQRINYEYFINGLRKKCSNTLELNKHKKELDEIRNLVNAKKLPPNRLFELANKLANRYSIYIIVHKLIVKEDPNHFEYDVIIYDTPLEGVEKYQKIEEIGVLVTYNQDENKNFNFQNLMTVAEFDDNFSKFFEEGIFNFDEIFQNYNARSDFESLIKDFYNLNTKESYNALSKDIITILSNTFWEVEERFPEGDELFMQNNLVKKYLSCNPDFGLIASTVSLRRKDDKISKNEIYVNHVANKLLSANNIINYKNEKIELLKTNGFIETIYTKFQEIIFEYYDHKNEGDNFEKRDKVLTNNAREYLLNDIENKLININIGFNNVYVSSNRFQNKRSYNFNDNSDFTSLLKIIERIKGDSKETCLEFINKWIKEFDIAEQMLLKPDTDTGDFKAYLMLNNQEVLLADFGLGTNQLLPIIFSLAIHFYTWNETNYQEEISKRTVVIEEPEANLHPAMQSKLADLFVDAFNIFGVQIIVETHSEYLIRKLQYLVGSNKSEITPQDVIVYYFYKPNHPAVLNKSVNQVEKIEIDEFGRLTKEFGTGFFDEADKIALDIFLLNQSQSN